MPRFLPLNIFSLSFLELYLKDSFIQSHPLECKISVSFYANVKCALCMCFTQEKWNRDPKAEPRLCTRIRLRSFELQDCRGKQSLPLCQPVFSWTRLCFTSFTGKLVLKWSHTLDIRKTLVRKNLERDWHTSRMKRFIYAPCLEDELTAFICGLIFGYLFRGRF